MKALQREPWRYNPQYGTAIDLNYCQFGFEITGECNEILCKFRTVKEKAPRKPMEGCRVACPKEREYAKPAPSTAVIDV